MRVVSPLPAFRTIPVNPGLIRAQRRTVRKSGPRGAPRVRTASTSSFSLSTGRKTGEPDQRDRTAGTSTGATSLPDGLRRDGRKKADPPEPIAVRTAIRRVGQAPACRIAASTAAQHRHPQHLLPIPPRSPINPAGISSSASLVSSRAAASPSGETPTIWFEKITGRASAIRNENRCRYVQ
jgi:hypothetical protein